MQVFQNFTIYLENSNFFSKQDLIYNKFQTKNPNKQFLLLFKKALIYLNDQTFFQYFLHS